MIYASEMSIVPRPRRGRQQIVPRRRRRRAAMDISATPISIEKIVKENRKQNKKKEYIRKESQYWLIRILQNFRHFI